MSMMLNAGLNISMKKNNGFLFEKKLVLKMVKDLIIKTYAQI